MEPWYRNYEMLGAYGAAGALILAVLGVFFGWLREWWLRPKLRVSYQDSPPCRRWAGDLHDASRWYLYFRLRVENRGRSIARRARGQLREWLIGDEPNPYLDPLQLHWVGTDFTPVERFDLLPGQTEFLDVFSVATVNRTRPVGNKFSFKLQPQYPVPRGVPLEAGFAKQRLFIAVSAENANAVRVELQLPDDTAGDPEGLRVDSRIIKSRWLEAWRNRRTRSTLVWQ